MGTLVMSISKMRNLMCRTIKVACSNKSWQGMNLEFEMPHSINSKVNFFLFSIYEVRIHFMITFSQTTRGGILIKLQMLSVSAI